MKYRSEIDGLRCLAVMAVVFNHAGYALFSGGFVGVDVFFVISGFLITAIIRDEIAAGRFTFRSFYERRARRILPALLLVILTTLPFAWWWLMPQDIVKYTKSILSILTITQNFFFERQVGYFEPEASLQPLVHTWSLGVEEQFYLLFPLAMIFLTARRLSQVLLMTGFASLLLSIYMLPHDPSAVFFLLPYRAWELLAGALAAIYAAKMSNMMRSPTLVCLMPVFGIFLILGSVIGYSENTAFPGVNALLPVVGTVLILTFCSVNDPVGRILSTRIFVGLGIISYSVYLWHQPVFALFRHRFGEFLFERYSIALVMLTIILAVASYYLVEKPFRRSASKTTVVFVVGVTAALIISSGGYMYSIARKSPEATPAFAAAKERTTPYFLKYLQRPVPDFRCGEEDEVGFTVCNIGDQRAPQTVALWGDSFARTTWPGLDKVLQQTGLGGLTFHQSACPPILGIKVEGAACRPETHDKILKSITENPEIKYVIVYGNFTRALSSDFISILGENDKQEGLRKSFLSTKKMLAGFGKKLILIEEGPYFTKDVTRNMVFNVQKGLLKPEVIVRPEFQDYVSMLKVLKPLVDIYISTEDFFCKGDICPSVDEKGKMVIYDQTHLTIEYACLLSKYVFEKVDGLPDASSVDCDESKF